MPVRASGRDRIGIRTAHRHSRHLVPRDPEELRDVLLRLEDVRKQVPRRGGEVREDTGLFRVLRHAVEQFGVPRGTPRPNPRTAIAVGRHPPALHSPQ